jgi:hypothetical protein
MRWKSRDDDSAMAGDASTMLMLAIDTAERTF